MVKTDQALAIDIGTSKIAIFLNLKGRIQQIQLSGSNSDFPCVIYYNNGVYFGNEALNRPHLNPMFLFRNLKCLIGRKFSEPYVQDIRKTATFHIAAGENDRVMVEVCENNQIILKDPTELLSMIVNYAIEKAKEHLDNKDIQYLALAFPPSFNDLQKQELMRIAGLTGIRHIEFYPETTAAAMYYGFSSIQPNQVLMIIDCGAGTCDISLLEYKNNEFQIIAHDGFENIGGNQYTEELKKYVYKQLLNVGIKYQDLKPRYQHKLNDDIEMAKRILRSEKNTEVVLEKPESVSITLTQTKLQILSRELNQKICSKVRQFLDSYLKSPPTFLLFSGHGMLLRCLAEAVSKEVKTNESAMNIEEPVAHGLAMLIPMIVENHHDNDNCNEMHNFIDVVKKEPTEIIYLQLDAVPPVNPPTIIEMQPDPVPPVNPPIIEMQPDPVPPVNPPTIIEMQPDPVPPVNPPIIEMQPDPVPPVNPPIIIERQPDPVPPINPPTIIYQSMKSESSVNTPVESLHASTSLESEVSVNTTTSLYSSFPIGPEVPVHDDTPNLPATISIEPEVSTNPTTIPNQSVEPESPTFTPIILNQSEQPESPTFTPIILNQSEQPESPTFTPVNSLPISIPVEPESPTFTPIILNQSEEPVGPQPPASPLETTPSSLSPPSVQSLGSSYLDHIPVTIVESNTIESSRLIPQQEPYIQDSVVRSIAIPEEPEDLPDFVVSTFDPCTIPADNPIINTINQVNEKRTYDISLGNQTRPDGDLRPIWKRDDCLPSKNTGTNAILHGNARLRKGKKFICNLYEGKSKWKKDCQRIRHTVLQRDEKHPDTKDHNFIVYLHIDNKGFIQTEYRWEDNNEKIQVIYDEDVRTTVNPSRAIKRCSKPIVAEEE